MNKAQLAASIVTATGAFIAARFIFKVGVHAAGRGLEELAKLIPPATVVNNS